ncbi:hypothetical protein [Chryseobacterium lactis]|uniref:hypothetical protein n=1 Tax=Chryseobacterium lactis TaxID=1241981 RepID=UPI001629AA37|nr:hypothetical protein [Chryseobacterium lactis]
MKEMDNLEKLINERNDLLKKYGNKSFRNEEEAKAYINANKNELKRLKEVQQEIKDIEWDSMSPQEKKEYLEYEKMLKEKYSDD